MSQESGFNIFKYIFTGTGKRQKELIKEYRDLIGDSPNKGNKILETILKIIRQEQRLRIFVAVIMILIAAILLLAPKFEKYIFSEITKEKAFEYLSKVDNRSNFDLKLIDSQVGIVKDKKIIGYLNKTNKDNLITINSDDNKKSHWIVQINSSENISEGLSLNKTSGNLFPKESYPAY